ncbi:hypothetical protein EV360DRAFT_71984 [Lentinula raphanica]|nr:hypothetical protein EV360DRAFT_71984 [Lentinula raphanica]
MKIEWASDFHRDGSRRRHPIPSTMHGWLAKMRGTLIGNETLRSQGIQEMKAAKRRKQAAKARAQSSKGRFSFFARKPAPQLVAETIVVGDIAVMDIAVELLEIDLLCDNIKAAAIIVPSDKRLAGVQEPSRKAQTPDLGQAAGQQLPVNVVVRLRGGLVGVDRLDTTD